MSGFRSDAKKGPKPIRGSTKATPVLSQHVLPVFFAVVDDPQVPVAFLALGRCCHLTRAAHRRTALSVRE
jgi:hypothetical protein